MFHASRLATLSIAFLLLTACSGLRVSQDYLEETDFSSFKTYRWDTVFLDQEKRLNDNNPLLNQRIHSAINNTLATLGYQKVDLDADFIVSYQNVIESRISSEGTSGTFAIGFGNIGRFGAIGISTGNEIHERDEATLMINVVDQQTNKLVWRGVSTRYVYTHNEPKKLTETINKHVNAILAQFPPKTGEH